MQVSRSTVIDAPIETVWRILRQFNSHSEWHPAIVDSRIDDQKPEDAVSAVRRFHLQDGSELTEQLLSLSDRDYALRYCLQETPIPLQNYVSEVSLKPVTDTNRTYWHWRSRFNTPPGRETELKTLVEDQIYQAGFDAIKSLLKSRTGISSNVAQTRSPETNDADLQPKSSVRYFDFSTLAQTPTANEEPGVAPIPLIKTDPGVIAAPAIMVSQYGGPEVMRYQEFHVPPPKGSEVRVRHHAIGVNYIDVHCRTGYFKYLQPPGGLGMEAAGEVIDVGAEVDRFHPGDRVAYAAPPVGAYSAVRNIAQSALVKLPSRISYKHAAAVMLKGMTAEFLLHKVHQLKQGETVLVHAAAGGVGTLVCQWAKTKGATVIGTVSTEEKFKFAHANGCHFPIIYTREDFKERVADITNGRGVDVVFDAIGRQTFADSVACVRPCGHVVSFGEAGDPLGQWDIGAFAAKSLNLSRPNFGHYTDTPDKISNICNNLFPALENGNIQIHIGQQFSLSDVVAAHHALEGRQTIGSTILIPE